MATASATEEDDWVKVAFTHDAVVADLLLHLTSAEPPPQPPSKRSRLRTLPALQLDWSVRQRRSSKHVPRLHHHHVDDDDAKKKKKKKKGEPAARASPTTPLSFSGATTSLSGAAIDGSEESSKPPKPIDAARSKVSIRSETTSSKRPRKKKTLAELKEEESLLLKERRNLKNELATLHLTVEKQKAANESLKKIKLDLQLQQTTMKVLTSAASGEAIWHQLKQVNAVGDPTTIMPAIVHRNDLSASQSSRPPNVSSKVQEVGSKDAAFPLPDLNLPFEDDLNSQVLYGMS